MSPTKNNSQFQRHCAGFMRNQRGSISVITVATMVPLMIAAGSAIDMGKANRTIGHMQKAVDTAALAGAATTQSYTGEAAKIDAAVRMVAADLPDQIKKGAEDPVVTVDGDVSSSRWVPKWRPPL